MKLRLKSVLALALLGCILAIVYSPFVDLPSTLETKARPDAQASFALAIAPIQLAAPAQAAPGYVPGIAIPESTRDVATLSCIYLC